MPTTFNVISLGNLADIDTAEGNNAAENASALVGLTFGGVNDALVNDFVSFSPGTGGFSGGSSSYYDQDNSPAENFKIDGGSDQVFDSAARYSATLTYTDGTTATVSVAIFQDTAGNTYLAPESSQNSSQDALEAGAIRSLTLDSLTANSTAGLVGDRDSFTFVACFTPGVRLDTPMGRVRVEDLVVDDLVTTRDNGDQPIRWIGRCTCDAVGGLVPVRIGAGALGNGLPQSEIIVSRQHRMLLQSKIAERMTGTKEVLVPAIKLLGVRGVDLVTEASKVTYLHVMFDRHEIIFAEGAPTESLMAGPMAVKSLGPQCVAEIRAVFPEILQTSRAPERRIVHGKKGRRLIERHVKNEQPLIHL